MAKRERAFARTSERLQCISVIRRSLRFGRRDHLREAQVVRWNGVDRQRSALGSASSGRMPAQVDVRVVPTANMLRSRR